MVVTRSIVADLNQGDKLNEKNYDVWHHKIQYLLEEQDMLETITQLTVELEHRISAQHRRDMEAYQDDKRKNRIACILMLSNMRNSLMLCFESNRITMAI